MAVRHFAVCLITAVMLNASAAYADALPNLGAMYYKS